MNLTKLNSITKYPSIPTYHALGERGIPTGKHENVSGVGYITEKIDGTNARIIVFPDGDYIIGSREELLTAKGDRVHSVATLDDKAGAQPEGVVVRAADRSWIVKLRFEDYRKVTA